MTTAPIWVFGMVDTSSSPAVGVMQVVPSCDAATLLPIIQQYTKPGTEVWSDEWSTYSNTTVSRHRTVNHSVHLKDPVTGIHTQFIESYWNHVKIKLKRMRGCHRDQLPSYLDEVRKVWKDSSCMEPFIISAVTLNINIQCN